MRHELDDSNKVEDIREKTDFSPQMFNQYRKRLVDKGVVSANNRGHMDFALPRFKEFVWKTRDCFLSGKVISYQAIKRKARFGVRVSE